MDKPRTEVKVREGGTVVVNDDKVKPAPQAEDKEKGDAK